MMCKLKQWLEDMAVIALLLGIWYGVMWLAYFAAFGG